ncbi:DUF1059 domain-containing protein [Pseudarthrobacter sp. PS3-L1]|uniref:DUF1059 domain-containing protein n=1 Tax=Pseudarthrobacter sp. PS3-L1 TaxID=3046207 RepID=UPI0024B945AC|nr:DUF1059 domain-containing protein [Pseudarthrobacter sp. PS3-L1]MDJ0320845.1 DUF1059 domain-containing protein [Pseudarthrobacter sp. PS3-L1]
MKAFACGDVVPGCEAQWVCSTEDEILSAVAGHAVSAHGLHSISEELSASVRGSITTVS